MEKTTNEQLEKLLSEIDYLSLGIKRGILDTVHAAEECTLKKEHYVKLIHKRSINQLSKTRKNGEVYTLYATRPNGSKNYIRATSEASLYAKLYDFYTTQQNAYTLNTLFQKALANKASGRASGKTIQEYQRTWNKFYVDTDFASMDVREVSVKEWKNFFKQLCKDNALTQKKFSDARIPANILMTYCVEEEIVPNNPINIIDYSDFAFAEDSNKGKIKAKPFTDIQVKKIVEWCRKYMNDPKTKNIYPLAILFNLNEGMRYAELAGLKWSDVDWDNKSITIQRQSVRKVEYQEDASFKGLGREIVNHTKAYVQPQPIPLTKDAVAILKEIKKLALSDEYIFPQGNFRYHTYASKIKLAATYAGCNPEDFHPHSIRATVATNVYKATHDLKQVQYVLRHTTAGMSSKYVDDWWALDAARKAMEAASL